MANKTLFASLRDALIPRTDTINSENAPAYALAPKQALAQYAATGCFGRTFYATAEEQLTRVLELCDEVDPEFVARVAIYSRTQSFMKDMPALLCAWLSAREPQLHETVFARVIDNARMLRNYVQILRSGVVGRKSLGSAPKRLVREWLASRDEDALFALQRRSESVAFRHREDGSPEAGRSDAGGVLRLHAGPVSRCECVAEAGDAVRAVQGR